MTLYVCQVFISKPHFFGGDSALLSNLTGLSLGNSSAHETTFEVEPVRCVYHSLFVVYRMLCSYSPVFRNVSPLFTTVIPSVDWSHDEHEETTANQRVGVESSHFPTAAQRLLFPQCVRDVHSNRLV